MSRSNYNWLIIYADGLTAIQVTDTIAGLYFEVSNPDDVVAIIRQELA